MAESSRLSNALSPKISEMSVIGNSAIWRLTPKNRSHPGHAASPIPARHGREDSGVHLTLKNIIGTTTSSANGFDANSENNVFACCAGPAAILSRVDEHCRISQQLFRARQIASALNSTPSFYNPSTPPSTPNRSRQGSPLKDGNYGPGSNSFGEDISDSPAHAKANARSREATCLSLSPGGQFLAVGETGYNPRVLLFSTAPDAPSDIPLSVLTDHSFGVACVGFSHNSRWLCTVGNGYDGFILIYSVNLKNGSVRLHSSNKCSNVNRIVWMGQSVVSIGIRHAKVWRLDQVIHNLSSKTSPDIETISTTGPNSLQPKTLSGRNCLLGALIDVTFTAAVTLSDCQAVLCTSQGDVCLLDDTDRTQRLSTVAKVEFCIECVTLDRENGLVWVAGEGGVLQSIRLDELAESTSPTSPLIVSSSHDQRWAAESPKKSIILAIGMVRHRIITINSDRIVEFRAVEADGRGPQLLTVVKRMPAHESAVLGVRSLLPKANSGGPDFLTFSKKGTVMFWMLDGTCTGSRDIPLDQMNDAESGVINELKVVATCAPDDILIAGDKHGVLRLTDCSGAIHSSIQAHSGDVNAIAIVKAEAMTLVASCGRDRVLQIFHKHDSHLELIQTLDDHAATVTDLMFMNGTSDLLSMSSDRTIIARKLALGGGSSLAYLPVRVITLKASPISFTHVPDEPNVVVVSMMDRQIQKYDVPSGRMLHSFKALDPGGTETVMIGSLEIQRLDETGNRAQLLLGVSSTDKSIRVHDYFSGSMLVREHGQKAVSAIKLIQALNDHGEPRNTLISCGLDSTVMIYNLSLPRDPANTPQGESGDVQSLSTKSNQPFRRILSKAEISSFQKSLEAEGDNITPLRNTSPSRMRLKTSRVSLAGAPKVSALTSTTTNHLASPASKRFDHKSSQSSTGLQNIGPSKIKRPSLDARRRSKSAANLNDLNDEAEKICQSLRTFQKRITSAAMGKIDIQTAQELENELVLTTRTLSEKISEGNVGSEKIAGDLLDVYLAKMIDERLALKAKCEGDRNETHAADVVLGDDA